MRTDCRLLRALIERWWDTTNTFHLRFAEMTVMPLDFSAITHLRVGGEPVLFDSGLYRDSAAIKHFLGREIGDGEPMVKCDHLPAMGDHEPDLPTEVAQIARAYLLYLFGVSLFLNRRSEVHLGWLPALADLSRVATLNFGGAALCILYCFLGFVNHGIRTSLGSFWKVLEVWAYEVLGMFPPANSHENEEVILWAAKWDQEHRGGSVHAGRVNDFCQFLDQADGSTV